MKNRAKTAAVIASPLITVLAILIIYAVKGIYPFGTGNVFGGDLYQQYIFNMYAFRDAVLNGELFFDFTTACGYAANRALGFLVPHNLFALIVKKETLPAFLSVIFIIKFALISLSAAFSFSRMFEKLRPEWISAVAIFYTFSGYNIQYFTNIDWLDVVALYPLLIYALKRMFDGKSKLMYIFILLYLLCIQTYMSFFVVISLIVFVGLYIFIVDEREKRKDHICALGIGTMIPLAASSYYIYNYVVSLSSTTRFEQYGTGLSTLTTAQKISSVFSAGLYVYVVCALMFLGTSLAVACIGVYIVKSIKNKDCRKYSVFFFLCFLLFALQAVIMGTDLVWHGGSRIMFPMRNGYMISFAACFTICFFFTRLMPETPQKLEKPLKLAAPVLLIAPLIAAGLFIRKYFELIKIYDVASSEDTQNKYWFTVIALIFLAAISYFGLLLFKNNKLKNALVLAMAAVLVFGNAYLFIGNPEGSKKAEKYNGYYSDFEEVKNLFEPDSNKLYRVSNPDLSLLTNYPYYTGTPAVSNWISGLTVEKKSALYSLGYATVFTRTLDSGGTAFSKALLGTKYSVSKAELNGSLYEKVGESDSFIKYKNRYSFPMGIVFDTSPEDLNVENYENTFEYQNAIFERLTGEKALFEKTNVISIVKGSDDYSDYCKKNSIKNVVTNVKNTHILTYIFTVKTKKNTTLYIRAKNENAHIYKAELNGEKVVFYKNAEDPYHDLNTVFPASFNNNVYELGTYKGEDVALNLGIAFGDIDDFDFYLMDNSKLDAYCSRLGENECSVSGEKVNLKVNSENSGYAFIPLSYSEEWTCTVNGNQKEICNVFKNFMAVPVESGENNIELSFSKTDSYKSIIVIAAAFIITLILALIERKIKKVPDRIQTLMSYSYMLLFAGAISIIYVLPIIYTFLM